MDFSEREIAKFVDVFVNNNIRIEFDKPEQFTNLLQSLTKQLESKILLERFNASRNVTLREYDVTNEMNLVSIGHSYPNRFFDSCPVKNVGECMEILLKIFSEVDQNQNVFDFMEDYGLMYSADEKYEGLYLWVTPQLTMDSPVEYVRHVFQQLYVDNHNLDFICGADDNGVRLEYVGFNKKNLIVKYGLLMLKESFYARDPAYHYRNYKKIDNIIPMFSERENSVGVQYVPGKPKSIAFERWIFTEDFEEYVDKMMDNEILTREEYERLRNFSFDNPRNFVVKYKWDSEEDLKVKIYSIHQ